MPEQEEVMSDRPDVPERACAAAGPPVQKPGGSPGQVD
jgi:hypothetical protein